jgi:hypothetical protein
MEIIENFLPQEYFTSLKNQIMSVDFPWFFNGQINANSEDDDLHYYMTHLLYAETANSSYYKEFIPLFQQIGIQTEKQLIRAKINMYPRTDTLHVNPAHIDFDYPHKGFILSFNSNDGCTVLKSEKVNSVENRALFFDSSQHHSSTTCTNAKARFNININYI